MNISSIRNNIVNIKIDDTNEEERLCSQLVQDIYDGNSADKLLKEIDIFLKKLPADKNKQIEFLEKAFSSCDVVQPFGKQPENIKATLEGIKDRIQHLSTNYFTNIDKIFKEIDIRGTLDEEVRNLNRTSDTATISKKLLQETNRKVYLKNIEQKPKSNKGNINQDTILTFPTGMKYRIQPTSGESNNCLIYAVTQGAAKNINRSEIFTEKNIGGYLIQMYDDSKSEYMTDDENFTNLKQLVVGIYNDASKVLESSSNISQLTLALLNYINTSRCFLDGQLAASILAMKFNQNMVIITPNHENSSNFTYTVISNKGEISHNGELSNEDLKKIEGQQNNVFIYNHNGAHFEWLKQTV